MNRTPTESEDYARGSAGGLLIVLMIGAVAIGLIGGIIGAAIIWGVRM